MRVCIDLDETLCTGYPYEEASPLPGSRELLSLLKHKGCTVILYTARGMGRSAGNVGKAMATIGKETFEQLHTWGFEYDEIFFGKPAADIYIDDKSLNSIDALLLKLEAK